MDILNLKKIIDLSDKILLDENKTFLVKFATIGSVFDMYNDIIDNQQSLDKESIRRLYLIIEKCHTFATNMNNSNTSKMLKYLDNYPKSFEDMTKEELIEYIKKHNI